MRPPHPRNNGKTDLMRNILRLTTSPKRMNSMSEQTIIQGDCLEVMKTFADKSFDLVLTDPPYGMEFQSNSRFKKHDKIIGDDAFPLEAFQECLRIARKGVYVCCRWDNLEELPKPKSVLAWVKDNWSMGDLKHEHGRQWEAVAFYAMDEHKFIKRILDVIYAQRTGNVFHPTEKPTELFKQLIAANEGDSILDPFMGSGTTLLAAKYLNRNATGIEISEKYCEIARKRLSQEQLQFAPHTT